MINEYVLIDDYDEIYDRTYVSLNIVFDDIENKLAFRRYKGKDKKSSPLQKQMLISMNKEELINFCNDWINDLKSLTQIQYEYFLNENGAFIEDKYKEIINADTKKFNDSVKIISNFKWKNSISIKYLHNENILIKLIGKYKKERNLSDVTSINLCPIVEPESQYYTLFYIKKYYLIRKALENFIA